MACKVLAREISQLIAASPNYIDVTFLRQGYHNEPDKLREILQKAIDDIDEQRDPYTCSLEQNYGLKDFDTILLGYGLCSNGIAGLSSKRYDIVVPKCHDCASLFLGSKERYKEIFDSESGGIYWYTPGWIENTLMPSKDRLEQVRKTYVELYSEENAEYLLEMEEGWLKEYKSAGYIDYPGLSMPEYKEFTKEAAEYLGWEYKEFEGDSRLLEDFLSGNWDEERFLIVKKGEKIMPSYDDNIIKSE